MCSLDNCAVLSALTKAARPTPVRRSRNRTDSPRSVESSPPEADDPPETEDPPTPQATEETSREAQEESTDDAYDSDSGQESMPTLLADYYYHLAPPGFLTVDMIQVTFFNADELRDLSDEEINDFLDCEMRGIEGTLFQRNHRILRVGLAIIELYGRLGLPWSEFKGVVKKRFLIGSSTAQAYKLYTQSVIKYPRLALVLLPFRSIKSCLASLVEYMDSRKFSGIFTKKFLDANS